MNLSKTDLKKDSQNVKISKTSMNIISIDPKTFEECTNLVELLLYGNQIRSIDSETFQKCKNLKTLWLYNNQIQYIHPKTYQQCVKLSLSFNKITFIDEFTFHDCICLEKLWLNHNRIVSVHKNSFRMCINLNEVYMNGNLIRTIHPDTFDCCTKLHELRLHDNYISCLVLFSLNSLKEVTFRENRNLLQDVISNEHGIAIGLRTPIIQLNKQDIETTYYSLKDAEVEIVQYILEFCCKHDSLMHLFQSFLRKKDLKQLNYILKINTICRLFQIDKIRNKDGQTLLHCACDLGDYDAVQMFCSYDAKIDIQDAHGKTPMHLAILSSNANKPTINALIAKGADSNEAQRFAEVTKKINIAQYIKKLREKKELGKEDSKIKNLIFQGGSVKGVAYLGALRVLVEMNLINLKTIRRVGGTSAGAIMAALLGVGYTVDELENILSKEMNFRDLIDNDDAYKNLFFELKDTLNQKKSTELVIYFIKKLIQYYTKHPVVDIFLNMPWTDIDDAISKNYGIFSGNKLRNFMENLIQRKTTIPNTTFKDIHNMIIKDGDNCKFKHIYITGVDLITRKTFKFSYKHSPNVPIADAIRISISIPIMFEPVRYKFENQFGQTIDGVFVDGGVFDNYPVWMFDNTKYLNEQDSSVGNKIFNDETLGLRIIDSNRKAHLESLEMIENISRDSSTIHSLNTYLSSLMKTLMSKQESDHHREKDDRQRTIYIDSCDVDMLDFDLSDKQINELISSGMKAASDYCIRLNKKPACPLISFSLLSELFKISNDSNSIVQSHNIYQLISENINKTSLEIPKVIYEFYSRGTKEEINYLKGLNLDILMRDSNGNTVLHLAALKNDKKTIDKIHEDLNNSTTINFVDFGRLKNNDEKTYMDILLMLAVESTA